MTTEAEAVLPASRGRIPLYLAGIVLVAAAIGYFVYLRGDREHAVEAERTDRAQSAAAGPTLAYVIATPGPPTRVLVEPGDVQAYHQVTVYAKVSGYLADLRVDRGDKVKANELLGVVTSPETDLQIAPLEANLATKQAIYDRLKPLVPQGVATPQDLDRANADITAARAQIEQLRALRGYDRILAPFAGTIITRYVSRGALLSAATGSTSAAQPLVDIADMSRVRIIVYLPQREATLVKEGDPVKIKRDNDPLHPTDATITRIPRELDPRTRTMPVEIEVPNDDGLFYPGVFVEVAMTVKSPPGVLIPADAVFLRNTKPVIALIKDNKAVFGEITIADDDGKVARVISGIAPGDHVAVHVGDDISDGMVVRAVEAPKPPTPGQPPAGAGSGSGSGAGSGAGSAAPVVQVNNPTPLPTPAAPAPGPATAPAPATGGAR